MVHATVQLPEMRNRSVAVLMLAMVVIGALAEPRKLLEAENAGLSDAAEHQRILAELEEVHQLRERMLQEGKGVCAQA